jgi:hypothetical protein
MDMDKGQRIIMLLTSWAVLLATAALLFLAAHACGSQRSSPPPPTLTLEPPPPASPPAVQPPPPPASPPGVQPPPPPPPPVTCPDGSASGAVRQEACPAGDMGQLTQVCTAGAWKDAANSCVTPPAPACTKTVYAVVQPIFAGYCATCHTFGASYATAQASAAEISRRVGLPAGDNAHMPLTGYTQFPAGGTEAATLQKWVTDGAVQDCNQSAGPQFIDLNYQNTAALKDILSPSVLPADRVFTRYIFLGDMIDAGLTKAELTKAELSVYVQAMNKALNGVNEDTETTATMQSVEPLGAVWRFDLRSFGLGAADIAAVDAADPFNLIDNTSNGQILQALTGTKKYFYQADNWVDTTYRQSAVYYQLLKIPATLALLQAQVGVNEANDLATFQANLIGSDSSPIAQQKSRILIRVAQDRNASAYWYRTNDVNAIPAHVIVNGVVEDSKNAFQFPLLLGAGGVENFTPDASEVIFQLKNGHQAYALFDGAGNRLNVADTAVVIDKLSPVSVGGAINNANSCSRCHNMGLIPYVDRVLASIVKQPLPVANDNQIVKSLYASAATNAALFRADNLAYGVALRKIGVDPNAPDPMNVITDKLLLPWDETMAASKLFLTIPEFEEALHQSAATLNLEGALLSPGGTVPEAVIVAALPQFIKDARLLQDSLN